LKEIYKNRIRPVKQIVRDMWMQVFTKLHLPTLREEVVEEINKRKLKKETVAEE